MARFRDACSVMLTRGEHPNPEVFVVLRSEKLRFFGGSWALPGGVLDAEDGSADDDSARRRCALRELFEETGVLLPELRRHLQVEASELRRGLLEGEKEAAQSFADLLSRCPQALESLQQLGRLTTPDFAPVRYRTDFFSLPLPVGEEPTIIEGELVRGRFARPRELEQAFVRGDSSVVPPLLFLMDCLADREAADFLIELKQRLVELEAGRAHPVRFSPGVFTIPLATQTIPPATTTNCHLVGDSRVYVVDPAPTQPAAQDRLCAQLARLREAGTELVAILLTHHHPDHIGAVRRVAEDFDLPVLAHPQTFDRIDHAGLRIEELVGGERLDLGAAPDGSSDWCLEVLHTPGHAPGHLCFVDSRYRAWIAGDLVSTLSTIVIDPTDGHLATYLDSLQRCLDLPLGCCLPAHGPAHRDAHAVIKHLIKHRTAREDKLRLALAEGRAQSIDALLAKVYDDVDPAMHPLARRSLLSGLQKLEEEGKAQREAADWRAVS